MNKKTNKKTYVILDDRTNEVMAIMLFDESIMHQEIKNVIEGVKEGISDWTLSDMVEELQHLDSSLIVITDLNREYI